MTVSTNAIGVVTGHLVVMVAVKSTFLLQKDGIVTVSIRVRGRVMELQSIATKWINLASKILVAKKEDVARVIVQVIREVRQTIKMSCSSH